MPGELTPAVDNGTVFVLSTSGNGGVVSAIAVSDGFVLWQTSVGTPGEAVSIAQSGLVVVGTQARELEAFTETAAP